MDQDASRSADLAWATAAFRIRPTPENGVAYLRHARAYYASADALGAVVDEILARLAPARGTTR